MKLINNITNLSNREIGTVIDNLNKIIDTIYYGKKEVAYFTIHKRLFKVQIHYLKKYTRYDIWEVKK